MMLATLALLAAARQSSLPTIYFVRGDSIYQLTHGAESKLIVHAVGPSPSPDGKRLAFMRDGNLFLLDLSEGTSKRATSFPEKSAEDHFRDTFPSWDPASKNVIFSRLDEYSVLRKGAKVDPMYGSDHLTRSIWSVYWYWADHAFRPKGNVSLFLGNETSGLSAMSVVSSMAGSFSPDGKRVAFCRNGDLWLADLDLSSIHNVVKIASWDEARVLSSAILEGGTRGSNETNAIFRIAWSPDSRLLVLSTDRYTGSGGADVQVVKADRPTETVVSFPGWDATFLDSGHLLYVKPYTDSENVWEYTIGTKEEQVLIPHASEPAVGRQ
ncbi:MAG: hypothetical protein P4L46_03700 [Fimbriimonas sp.]|nr:hypothetical protein [Fimbriimonas sp.]